VALPVYLRQQGVSLTGVGFAGALALPWLLKALWAPLVDRFYWRAFGRRRSWIVPMQLGLVLACAAAAGVGPETERGLYLLLGLVFAMNLLAATQDVAVDGLAVDVLRPDELGYGNAAQVVGYKLGMLTGGGLLVWASGAVGWEGLFALMGMLMAGVLLLTTLGLRERAAAAEGAGDADGAQPTLREILAKLKAALAVPGGAWLLVFVGTYKLGEALVDAMFKPFLVDVGFTAAQIGAWLGTWGMLASLLGSLLGGLLAARVSLWKALALTAALRLVPLAGEWALAAGGAPSGGAVIAVTVAESLFGGALTTAMFAFMMSRVDRSIGATHYTVLACVEVLGKSPGVFASGKLAEVLGYAGLFGLGTLLSAAFLLLLIPLRRSPSGPKG